MGICRFFQQGTCRFGAKCNNEHFDVKQYLKTDIESSINGKMWPFSSYGPFKDKPSIPNFIEDQSFEEVRLQAYESRRQNCFDQFHQQFTKEVHEATNKMKVMLQMTPQILDVMIKIYDTPETGAQPAANNNNNNNPFSFSNNNAAQTNSIFAKPALGSNNTGNLFGNAAANNSFAAAPAANNIFGGGSASSGNNIFGGAASTNIFSQQPQQQQQFGQAQPSIFAQSQPPQQHNPFMQPQAATSTFPGSGNIFAQALPANTSPFAPQQQQQQAGGIFGPAAAAPNTGNIFGQAVQSQQQPGGFFGQSSAGFQQQPQQQQMQSEAIEQPQVQMQQQQMQPQSDNTSGIYSRLEDLTPEEIAAFRADQFTAGQVPFKPPPRELC